MRGYTKPRIPWTKSLACRLYKTKNRMDKITRMRRGYTIPRGPWTKHSPERLCKVLDKLDSTVWGLFNLVLLLEKIFNVNQSKF